jgi:uncharacterized damage-inducible protein DinB
MTSHLKDLLAHHAWADAVFFHAWGASPAQEDGELRTRVAHIVEVQEGFLKVLKGEALAFQERPLPDFGELKLRTRATHEVYAALARTLDEVSLAQPVRIPWFPDPPCIISGTDALMQVCLHTQHHRGQNMARLKALGVPPKNVDYIIWLWKQKPEPRWD